MPNVKLETKDFTELNVSKVLYSGNIKLTNTKDNKKSFNNKDVLINNKFWCAMRHTKMKKSLFKSSSINKKYKTIKTIMLQDILKDHEIKNLVIIKI